MFAACGTTDMGGEAATEEKEPATAEEIDAEAAAVDLGEDTGKVLNIYVWNEEFKSRVTDHYPNYEEVDATHGKIGDVDVVWQITENAGNAYQDNLDAALEVVGTPTIDGKAEAKNETVGNAVKFTIADATADRNSVVTLTIQAKIKADADLSKKPYVEGKVPNTATVTVPAKTFAVYKF